MTGENNLKLVGKGSRRLMRMTLIRNLIKQELEACKLKVVIEDIYGEKKNLLVNASSESNYHEDNVVARFKNASDMFNFLRGYYSCFKNLSK